MEEQGYHSVGLLSQLAKSTFLVSSRSRFVSLPGPSLGVKKTTAKSPNVTSFVYGDVQPLIAAGMRHSPWTIRLEYERIGGSERL